MIVEGCMLVVFVSLVIVEIVIWFGLMVMKFVNCFRCLGRVFVWMFKCFKKVLIVWGVEFWREFVLVFVIGVFFFYLIYFI